MTALLKTTYKIRAALLTLGTGLMICSSCTDEDFVKAPQNGDRMSFGVSISDQWTAGHSTRSAEPQQPKYEAYQFNNSEKWVVAADEPCIDGASFGNTRPTTRAAEVSKDNFESTYPSFGVYAFASSTATGDDDWNQTDAGTKLYISGEQATDPTNDIWSTVDAHYWPGADYRMKFFAWAPYSNSALKVSLNANNTPEFEYTVPNDVSKQSDVLFATDINEGTKENPTISQTVKGDYNKPVPLRFRHALTAVKVRVAKGVTGKVTKVQISGVHGSGKYTFGADSWIPATENPGASYSTPEDWSVDLGENTNNTGVTVVDNGETFMLMPQELTSTANLEVFFEDGTHLSGTIGGEKPNPKPGEDKNYADWKVGHTIVYTISHTSIIYEFEVTPEVEINVKGETKPYEVKSYKIDGATNTITPVKWSVIEDIFYKIENDKEITDYDQWTWSFTPTSKTGNGTGSINSVEDNTTVGRSKLLPVITRKKYLSNDEFTGNDTHDNGTRNLYSENGNSTANCYMVHRRGRHKFPLIYGNAIKNSSINKNAYTYLGPDLNTVDLPTDRHGQILNNFIDGNGNKITSPRINASSCEMVMTWCDIPDLIQLTNPGDISVSKGDAIAGLNDIYWCEFRILTEMVDCSDIYPTANVLLSLRDKTTKKIVWNWHIWFTPYDPSKGLVSANGYQFMPVNLGWCDAQTAHYTPRKRVLKFKQEESEIEQVMTVIQTATDENIAGYQPNYQWGRKEPMVAAGVGSTETKKIYVSTANGQSEYIETSFNVQNVGSVGIATATNNPATFYMNGESWDWDKNHYFNLWNANEYSNKENTSHTPLVKTVYDPCPAGFMVPPPQASKGFENKNNWRLDNVDYGWTVSTDGGSLYFPKTGRRHDYSGEINEIDNGEYWTCARERGSLDEQGNFVENDIRRGIFLSFPNPQKEQISFQGASNACAIRPVKEP